MEKPNPIKVNYNEPYIVGKELYYIAQAVQYKQLAGNGNYAKICNQWMIDSVGAKASFMVHSCTAALEISAILADLKPGDEVIMPSFTFVSTANAIVLRGACPVFVDIRPDTLNIDETLIEAAITPKTKAIVAVHYAGVACEMDTLLDICKRHHLFLIEDAAQALNCTYKGKALGSFGDVSCFSFHETKNLISGEGGALLINNKSLIKRTEIIHEKGTDRSAFFRNEVDKYTWQDIGSSYAPSEVVTAFLAAQMEQAEQIMNKRRKIYSIYHDGLRDLSDRGILTLPNVPDHCQHNGHIYAIRPTQVEHASKLLDYLNKQGIYAIIHYVPLHSSPAGQKYSKAHGALKVTELTAKQLVRLPTYFTLKDETCHEIIKHVHYFFEHIVN